MNVCVVWKNVLYRELFNIYSDKTTRETGKKRICVENTFHSSFSSSENRLFNIGERKNEYWVHDVNIEAFIAPNCVQLAKWDFRIFSNFRATYDLLSVSLAIRQPIWLKF